MQTWVCRECGKICFSQQELLRHCQEHVIKRFTGSISGGRKCPNCGGTGMIVHFLGPNEPCKHCNGLGRVPG